MLNKYDAGTNGSPLSEKLSHLMYMLSCALMSCTNNKQKGVKKHKKQAIHFLQCMLFLNTF